MSQEFPPIKAGNQCTVSLYELPTCTICLGQLAQELVSFECGHVFHSACIYTNLSYRKSCPNCNKRIQITELRPVVMSFQPNQDNALKKFLQKFCSEGEQDMLKEALQKTKAALEEQDKLKQSNKELAGELNNQKNEIEKLRREIDASMNQRAKLEKNNMRLYKDLEEANRDRFRLNCQKQDVEQLYNILAQENQQNKILKQIRSAMNNDSNQLLEEKKKFQQKGQFKEGLDYFCLLAMSTRLDLRQIRKDRALNSQQTKEISHQNNLLKGDIQRLNGVNQKWKEENQKLRQKIQKIKFKYTALLTKIKQLSPQEAKSLCDFDDSNSIKFDTKAQLTKEKSFMILENEPEKPKTQNLAAQTKKTSLIDQIGGFGSRKISSLPLKSICSKKN